MEFFEANDTKYFNLMMMSKLNSIESVVLEILAKKGKEEKHGYWKDICVKNGYGDIIEKHIECSECKEFFKVESHTNEYWKRRFKNCPFCGAKMDGESK